MFDLLTEEAADVVGGRANGSNGNEKGAASSRFSATPATPGLGPWLVA